MFAARGGFVYFEEAAPSAVPAWQTMTPAEITSEVETWELTGSRSLDTSFALGTTILNVAGAYRSAVLHPNGNVYLAPCTKATNNILEIDLQNSVATEIATGQTLSGAVKFISGCLGSDGKIYYPPRDFNKVLIADPANASYTVQDWGLTLTGGVYTTAVASDNKIYAMGDADILIIDVEANTAILTTYGIISGTTVARHVAGVRSIADGCVYFGPYGNTHVFRIDPVSNTATSSTYGVSFGSQAAQGIANGKDGWIYLPRHNNGDNFKFDPVANIASTVGGSSTKTVGATTGPDGNVYCHAFNNSNWIDVTANIGTNSPTFMPNGVQRWGGLYAHGKVWTFPDVTTNTHVVPTTIDGTGVSSAWSSNVSLSNYFNWQK